MALTERRVAHVTSFRGKKMSKYRKINNGDWQRSVRIAAKTENTAEQYVSHINKFLEWVEKNGLPLRISEEKKHSYIQSYLNYLDSEGYSPATIKKYLAALTCGRDENMKSYNRPVLKIGEGQKGRNTEVAETYKEDRVFKVAPYIGCRKSEYARLKSDDLIERDGRLFVCVKKGKGGKNSEYLIERDFEEAIREFFGDIRGKLGYILSLQEVGRAKHMNLHARRRLRVLDLYYRFKTANDDEKKWMRQEMKYRLEANPKKKGRYKKEMTMIEKNPVYKVRGSVREDMERRGLPLEYDREALLYASINVTN